MATYEQISKELIINVLGKKFFKIKKYSPEKKIKKSCMPETALADLSAKYHCRIDCPIKNGFEVI